MTNQSTESPVLWRCGEIGEALQVPSSPEKHRSHEPSIGRVPEKQETLATARYCIEWLFHIPGAVVRTSPFVEEEGRHRDLK